MRNKALQTQSIESLSYEELLQTFKTILKNNNLKFTAQREAILKTLYDHPGHFTPEDLYLLVKEECPQLNTGITTVYRTLNLLEENKLVTSLSFGIQGKKFELGNKSHHDHIICEKCGAIVEFEDPDIENLQQKIATKLGFKLTSHLLQLYGICKKCQEQE
jgi:Fur family ferric uptake transcriptional regulator